MGHALTPPPELPGRARLYSVPYGGRGQGSKKRLKKQKRVKLTKVQKKALKWARKNPENTNFIEHAGGVLANVTAGEGRYTQDLNLTGPVTLRGNFVNVNITSDDSITIVNGTTLFNSRVHVPTWQPVTNIFDNTNIFTTPTAIGGYTVTGTIGYLEGRTDPPHLNQYIGQPATPATYQAIQETVTIHVNNLIVDGALDYQTNIFTDTDYTGNVNINVGTGAGTIVQDWAAWNTVQTVQPQLSWEQAPAKDWGVSCKKSKFDPQWAGMCGRGHSNDLWFNPNDQLQKRRLRNERDVLREAQRAQERMEWEANRPAREEAARVAAAERQVVEAARQERRALAKDRSYVLLHRHLTDEQMTMLENESRFLIEVNSGKVYEIRRGIHQNIYLLNGEGRITEQLCAAPRGDLPEGDAMLAQMLHLMTNEEAFRRVANIFNMADHRHGQADRRLPLRAAA